MAGELRPLARVGGERPLHARAVVVLKVDEIYQAQGGPGLGDRIL